MTTFEYGIAIDGAWENHPELRDEVERRWTKHRYSICKILDFQQMFDWKVKFVYPRILRNEGSGGLVREPLKIIIIGLHSRHEMVATFFHEILHAKHRGWTEEMVEAETQKVFPQE